MPLALSYLDIMHSKQLEVIYNSTSLFCLTINKVGIDGMQKNLYGCEVSQKRNFINYSIIIVLSGPVLGGNII